MVAMTVEAIMECRRHPDLFTPAEAMEYLHLSPDAERTLETLRTSHGLRGVQIGKSLMYHRADLDKLVEQLWGLRVESKRNPRLKIGGTV
jgi:hypothetical protein